MADERLKPDNNAGKVVGGITDDANLEIRQLRVNPSTNRLLTEATTGGSSSISTGTISVATAGTKVQFPSVSCTRAFIQASETNTGVIVVGDTNVVAAVATRRGLAIYPTNGVWFNVSNLNLLYIDSVTNNDGAHYFVEV